MYQKLKKFFLDNINFCEEYYFGTDIAKPNNVVYNWFYNHWLYPWKQNNCICCNAVRGLIYGIIIGSLF